MDQGTRGQLTMFRTIALIAAAAGGAGSVTFLLRAGNRNSSLALLVALFSIWVAAPFVALVWAIVKSDRWATFTRTTVYWLTIGVALGSLAIYSRWIDVKPAGSPNTFLFVVVPPLSLAIITFAISIAAFVARKRQRPTTGRS
ncbi:MAG: hypothetical protein ABIP90_08255 [Vicinamibacterales bacterium]